MVEAAIYLPGKSDPHMHASMSCDYSSSEYTGMRLGPARITPRYHVTSIWDALNKGKKPCPGCWTVGGYRAEDDIIAGMDFE